MKHRILVINPGSTSTKLAIYDDETLLKSTNLHHSYKDLSLYKSFAEQRKFRELLIETWLKEENISMDKLKAIVARGGLLAPIPSGTYAINLLMIKHLEQGIYGKHAANLAALIAYDFSSVLNIPSFIVDPVVVDELNPVARISGFPSIERRSIFHALNHKASAKKAAELLGRPYKEINLIVAHLGGGISVAAHHKGQVIDVNNALSGEGPFSPERAGSLPTKQLINYYFKHSYSRDELITRFTSRSGLIAHFNTNDTKEIVKKIKSGDEQARYLFEAMCYQITKEVGRIATVLSGIVDQIVITGGLAHSNDLIEYLRERVEFIAPLTVLPGENEMEALALGALRVLKGKEKIREYRV